MFSATSCSHLIFLTSRKYTARVVGLQFKRILFSSDTKSLNDIFVPLYSRKPNETDGQKRARLLYQSRKRGMLENDLLLSTFVDKYLIDMSAELLAEYDELINSSYSDLDIYYWATGSQPIPSKYENEIMRLLKEHVQDKMKERPLRQPELPNYMFNK